MIKRKWYNLNKKSKTYITYVAYLIFDVYMLSLLIREPTILGKLIYGIFLVILIVVTFLHEYLNVLYNKCINLLTDHCDPIKGLKLIDKLEKLDLFNSYRQSILVYKLLAYRDLNKFQDILELLEKVTIKPFKASYDLLLIYHYSLFLSYIHLNNTRKVKEHFKICMDLKDKGTVKKKILPILSWSEIEGVFYLYENDLKAARKSLSKVNPNNMNNRERYNFLMNLSLVEIKTENYTDAKNYLKEILNGANSMYVKSLAYQIAKKYNTKLGGIVNEN